jgi:hypothetical protein
MKLDETWLKYDNSSKNHCFYYDSKDKALNPIFKINQVFDTYLLYLTFFQQCLVFSLHSVNSEKNIDISGHFRSF